MLMTTQSLVGFIEPLSNIPDSLKTSMQVKPAYKKQL
jgi:hypothetical protein